MSATESEQLLELSDDAGEKFSFRALRTLRDGLDLFLIAERVGHETMHVLHAIGGGVVLVKDARTLHRVARRIEILQRAYEGELITSKDESGEVRWFGVFDECTLSGRKIALAVDLADAGRTVAFVRTDKGVELADDATLELIHRTMTDGLAPIEDAREALEAATLGAGRELIEISDPKGNTRRFRGAGRMFFEKRDVLFLTPEDDAKKTVAAEVKPGGRLEWLADQGLLDRLARHLAPQNWK